MAKRAQVGNTAELPDLEDLVGYNLKRAYVTLQVDFRATLEADDLAPRVFSALSLVVQYPKITQSALARMLGIERSGLVAIVDSLEARGYLARASVPGDRRVQALVPTAVGARAHAAAAVAVREHEARMLADLSAEEVTQLVALLRKIRARGEQS